jgi:hypothetical protein
MLGPYKKQMPKGEARPLGTPRPKKSGKKNLTLVEKNAGHSEVEAVSLVQTAIMPTVETKEEGAGIMTLTLKGTNKKNTQAIYSGLKTSVRFALAAFEGKQAPQTIEVQGPFAAPAAPKVKLSKEERAALAAQRKEERKNAPKPTLAERIAKREASLAALKAKAQAQEASL